ncbi:hypothetical protein EU538_08590 [Candidatus Thorarchaeota archaeon]|jgi:hypothetical protein|nr:MAG: hypothetical protein EU538_08590 [Candidatus Thorarchaeota archaeon]
MSNSETIYVPPVVVEDYDEFIDAANRAAVVLYDPEYFQSPFLDDQKRIRRVTLTAIGVEVKGLPLTFKHILDYQDLLDPSKSWEEVVSDIDSYLREGIQTLDKSVRIMRGSLETHTPLGKALSMHP